MNDQPQPRPPLPPPIPPPRPAAPPPVPSVPWSRRYGTVIKMGMIFILVLLLLIPLTMIRSVLDERMSRRNEAVADITSTWGAEQVIAGPVLIIPYRHPQKTWKEQVVNGRVERVEVVETVTSKAYFLPAVVDAEGNLDPSRLHRGIYETVVYSGTVKLSGHFAAPSFEEWKIDPAEIQWEDAELALSVTDLRGARESLSITFGDQTFALRPGSRLPGLQGGVYTRLAGAALQGADKLPFELSLSLNGSRSLRFAPVGASNTVQLSSPWPDPSFQGAFLPLERTIGPDGFQARWQVSYYGRSYPQQWTDASPVDGSQLMESLFGVDLMSVVDAYRYVERSIKYGALFIVLLFTVFFLFEVLSAVRIHPFQYTLVGVALCLFYLALLALSEMISFGAAYWTGAVASTLMISLYSHKALKGGRRAGIVAGGLAAIYAFLFVILRMQDYSLLVGTAGLFLALAAVMYATRNIDWYARDAQ